MTAQKDKATTTVIGRSAKGPTPVDGQMSRRRMIRGAAAAVPTILTLHSGAAMAITSNLISRADGAPVDALGNNMCLDENSVAEVLESGRRYDLGDPASGVVTNIPTTDGRQFYPDTSLSGSPLTGQQMCEQGGTFYYEGEGATTNGLGAQARADLIRQSFIPEIAEGAAEKAAVGVEVPRGALVSATALASFGGRIMFRTI